MADFKKGDTVQLKSGGPIMTIDHMVDYANSSGGTERGAKCMWFADFECKEKVFNVAALEQAHV